VTPAEVAAALVAHPRFEWAAGARASNTKFARVLALSGDPADPEPVCASEEGATSDDNYATWLTYGGAIPDLADPATAGVLLEALIREDVFAVVYYGVNAQGVLHASLRCSDRRIPEEVVGATLGEAVARALLAVWGPA
jgi:hypothetical protein